MLHALAFVSMFVIGGLSGIFMASTPVDIFIHDTYYIVAHIHYVVFGGSVFGIFAAITYWFPKLFGRMMNEALGKVHWLLSFIAFNCTFFPMHILGVGGHMRRIYNPTQYEFLLPLQPINVFITLSALLLGLSQLLFVVNFFASLFGWNAGWFRSGARVLAAAVAGYFPVGYLGRSSALAWALFAVIFAGVFWFLRGMDAFGATAPRNPWNANTLEWQADSPPPHGNWGPTLPSVYRGPYEYSSPEVPEDYLPQARRLTGAAAPAH